MRRYVVLFVALSLVVGGAMSPAAAKKKKKKPPVATLTPVDLKYFLHWDSDGATPEGCTGLVHMSLEDAAGDTTCSSTTQIAQELLAATGQELVSYVYPATTGLPFLLDSSKKLTGSITLRGTVTVQSYAEVVLTGNVGGVEVTIAEGETDHGDGALSNTAQGVELPGPAAIVTFEADIKPELDKQQVTALNLQVTVRGLHRGGIDYERDPSFIVVPGFTSG